MALRAQRVFVPGAYPEHTYVERTGERFEIALKDALDTEGQLVSLSGPSKSGKTVLVERVVGRDNLIAVSGAGIREPDDVWSRVLDWMDVPNRTSTSHTTGESINLGGKASGGASISFLAKGEAEVSGHAEASAESERTREFARRGLSQVVDEIAGSAFVVLIDDFHYMDRPVQVEVAKSLKEAVRLGIKVVTAAVRHRGDDVVRANPELRGRVRSVDLTYWRIEELRAIAMTGFRVLNVTLPPDAIDVFVQESAGSPQLMQSLCLQSCFALDIRESVFFHRDVAVSEEQLRQILEQTSSTTFRSLVDVIDAGPKKRGTERKEYSFQDGTSGDVYRCVLKAVAADPPRLSLPYDELLQRTASVCVGDSPVGSSVAGTSYHMSDLALRTFPNERAIDWDEQKTNLRYSRSVPPLLFEVVWPVARMNSLAIAPTPASAGRFHSSTADKQEHICHNTRSRR